MNRVVANGLEISRKSPRVVGTITTRACLEDFPRDRRGSCDIAEVRLDQIGDIPGWSEACRAIEAAGTPVLLTLRSVQEGGKCGRTNEERLRLMREALTCSSLLDVELSSGLAETIKPEADRAGKTLIISFHDFSGTPTQASLEAIIAGGEHFGPIVKLATMIHTEADLAVLDAILAEPRGTLLCLIGMGAKGQITRTAYPARGSCLTYGFLDSIVAPGQLSAAELMRRVHAAAEPPPQA
jgi:3-dehydroquinate dehydratase type I